MRSMHSSVADELCSPVLLVCIYNQQGNIITHNYLYELFSPYGDIAKILIFEKAKVWKTFIEFDRSSDAELAMEALNNKVIFPDGSKMNIFRSKLKHIQLQNDNLGGVDYENLKEQEQQHEMRRPRRSTYQDHSHAFSLQPCMSQHGSYEKEHDESSTSGKYHSESLSADKSGKGGSLSNLMEIDEQFREIALQSEEYREWQETSKKEDLNWEYISSDKNQQGRERMCGWGQSQEHEAIRRKSKTIVNPNSQQFLLQNCPSKVLFIRSIPQHFTNVCIYNIFANFGMISKVIYIRQKASALVEFNILSNAIQAKDQINYVKSQLKVFYSHYDTLILRKTTEDEEEYEYKSQCSSQSVNFNPPTQTLYMTQLAPAAEDEVRQLFADIGCPLEAVEWKQQGKDKWMCLLEFRNLMESLFAMGSLQGRTLSSNRKMKLSFTRSKLQRKVRLGKVYEPIRENDQYL